MSDPSIGYALCASYCTFDKAIGALESLRQKYQNITPVMSEKAYSVDTRFGSAAGFIERIEALCGRAIIHTIKDAEPIGPGALFDILIIAPCTGNTLAKLACGITDSSVTMAAKAHMRNGRPVLIGISTNDALGGNARNLGALLDRKNIYFIPFYQDDPAGKPSSLIADFDALEAAVDAALEGRQLQPLLRVK